MPYAAAVRQFIEDGLSEQCDSLLTALKNKGPQNVTKWRSEVVEILIKEGIAIVVDVPFQKRNEIKKVIFLRS